MSDNKKRKKSRRKEADDYADAAPKKSLVDYSKVSARPDAAPRRSGPEADPAAASGPAAAAPPTMKMTAQMEAVYRLKAGMEERTLAQKLADSNRPTWEQYKKDNEDKLNLEGVDQKKMEEYRQELDKERDKRLARGTNHGASKKKKKRKKHSSSSSDDDDDDDDSSTSSSDDRKQSRKKKHKKKKDRKRRKHKRRDDSDSDSDSSDNNERKRKRKKKKKKSSKKDDNNDGNDSDGSHYRLSKFFTAGSDDED